MIGSVTARLQPRLANLTTNFTTDAAAQPAGEPAPLRLGRSILLGLVATLSMAGGAMYGGKSFETHLPGAWFFGMPGGLLGSFGTDAAHPPIGSLIAVYGGLILLIRTWVGLLRYLRHNHGVPIRKIIIVVAIWAVPFLLAPPTGGGDVYSYAGQGEMVSHHINPYDYGTGVLGSTPFSSMPASIWTNTPSPYGPTFLALDGELTAVSGHKILPDIMLLRLLEVAGLALVIAATPTLARALRRDPAEAILLGVGSPVVLTSIISGAHNDALMIGLLMAGLALAQRVGTVPGLILCALAAGVKAPAVLGILFLGWVWAGPGASVRRRVGHTLGAIAIGLCAFEVVTLVAGLGWGWVRNSTAADKAFTFVTPIGGVSRLVSWVAHAVDIQVSAIGVRDVLAVVGLVIAGIIGAWLLWRSPRDGVTRNLGLTLLVLAILSPILWAWYVTWGLLVLAAVASGRLRTALIVIAAVETFFDLAAVRGILVGIGQAGVLEDIVLAAALVAIAIVPLNQMRTTRRRRRDSTPSPGGRPLAGSTAIA
jgi:alpha-1,6-mannosyltransferase